MDARMRLAIGGSTTFLACAAVVGAIALSNVAATADESGAPIGAAAVVVHASGASAPDAQPRGGTATETVPAPDAVVIAKPTADGTLDTSLPTSTERQLIAAAASSGDWSAVEEWAQGQGWSASRTSALVQRLQSEVAAIAAGNGNGNAANAPGTGNADGTGEGVNGNGNAYGGGTDNAGGSAANGSGSSNGNGSTNANGGESAENANGGDGSSHAGTGSDNGKAEAPGSKKDE